MTTKSFIRTIGEKGLLADYNTSGKKLQTEDSIDQTYSPTSTKAQSGVAVNEAFKTRETSISDDSYTYLGMNNTGSSTEKLYWKLVSFKPSYNYWTLQFEIDVCNGRKGNRSFDTEIYETKRLTIYSGIKDTVENAIELRYISQSDIDVRGYGNNIYYEMDSSGTVTIYIYAAKSANKTQICRLTSVRNFQNISNITWYEPVADAGTQPTNPVKFKEAFPCIASKTSDIGSDSVPVYVNRGKPVSCNSSKLKAGKDDDGNVIKNTYQKKLTFDTTPTAGSNNPVTSDGVANINGYKKLFSQGTVSSTVSDSIILFYVKWKSPNDSGIYNRQYEINYSNFRTGTSGSIKIAPNITSPTGGTINLVSDRFNFNDINFGVIEAPDGDSNHPYWFVGYGYGVGGSIEIIQNGRKLTYTDRPVVVPKEQILTSSCKFTKNYLNNPKYYTYTLYPPTTGTFILKAVDGSIQWVAE